MSQTDSGSDFDPHQVATDTDDAPATLSQGVVSTATVQQRGGSFVVSFPKDAARDLGIEKGSQLVYLGDEGDADLSLMKAERLLDR